MSDLQAILGDRMPAVYDAAAVIHGTVAGIGPRTAEKVAVAALAAVLPALLAEAWDEGHAAGCADPYKRYNDCGCGPNPYRPDWRAEL